MHVCVYEWMYILALASVQLMSKLPPSYSKLFLHTKSVKTEHQQWNGGVCFTVVFHFLSMVNDDFELRYCWVLTPTGCRTHQHEAHCPWSFIGVVNLPLQSTDVSVPVYFMTVAAFVSLLLSQSTSAAGLPPRYLDLNSSWFTSHRLVIPYTAVPFLDFSRSLSASIFINDSWNVLYLFFSSRLFAYCSIMQEKLYEIRLRCGSRG